MKLPRIRIAWVMLAIAILAIDFAVMRALMNYGSASREELLFGAVPMANELVVGLLIWQQRPNRRLFFTGFELFGAIALAFYIALALLLSGRSDAIHAYVAIALDPIAAPMRQPRTLSEMLIVWFVVLFMLAWPQIAFALIGGYLSSKHKVAVTRR